MAGPIDVAVSGDPVLHMWDAESGKQIGKPLTSHTAGVLSAEFSCNGKRVVTASSDKTVRPWDAESGQQIGKPLTGHTHRVSSAAFSP